MKKYRLEVTEYQLKLIREALEEYFRLPLNQWMDLADRLTSLGYVYENTPEGKQRFHEWILRRNAVHEVLKTVGRILWEHNMPQKEKPQIIAEDIWSVIRHQEWLETPQKDQWDVRSTVYIWGDEPEMKIEVISD